jgi:hypothetical protein
LKERLKLIDDELNKLEGGRNDLIQKINKATQELTDQLQGRAGAPAGDGKLSQALRNIKENLENQLLAYDQTNKQRMEELIASKKKLISEMDEELAKNKKVANGLDGLLERIKLAHRIAGFWISLFITLLFMTIELTPIFFKLMLVKTPYDYMEENIKELIKAEEGIYIQYKYYEDKQGLERDLVTYMKVEKMIHEKVALLEKQKELTKYAVDKYGDNIKRQIDANPDAFIKATDDVNTLTEKPTDSTSVKKEPNGPIQ